MFGPIGYALGAASGYIGARVTARLIEPQTVDVMTDDSRKIRIVKYWDVWPPKRNPRRFRAEELRAPGTWLKVGVDGDTLEGVQERVRVMLSPGPK